MVGAKKKQGFVEIFVGEDLKLFQLFCFSCCVISEIYFREERVVRLSERANRPFSKRVKISKLSKKGLKLYKATKFQSFSLEIGETFSPKNLSLSFLSKKYSIAKSKAFDLKKLAIEKGFLSREKKFARIPVPALFIEDLKNEFKKYAHRLFKLESNCAISLTDSLTYGTKRFYFCN